ncbi:MAG TPA: TolC family protein [Usitatibacter sp.]|nr:TolC family protein [Usitatibacter sp.]
MNRLPFGLAATGLVYCIALPLARAADGECAAPPPPLLSLAAAEERVARCNRDVVAARLAVAAAQADLRVASQRPNPVLTLGASNMNPQAGFGSGSLRDKTFDSSLRIDQLIERGGKAELREAQATALLEAARADIAEQLRSQRLAVRTAFFDLAAAQERVRLQQEFADLSAQSARASGLREDKGDVSRVEANRFRLDAARTANDSRQARADRERARADLARILGAEAYASGLEVRVEWPETESRRQDGDRPDVAAARLRLQAALAGRELARLIATRDVTLSAQADHWPTSETNMQGTGISYSLYLSLPLHVRHANEGEAARAAADFDTAQAVLLRLQAQADADAKLAQADWEAARERREHVATEVRPLARDVAAAAEFAYSKGATGVFDLLDARRSLKAVELDEVQANGDAAKAWARREASLERLEP